MYQTSRLAAILMAAGVISACSQSTTQSSAPVASAAAPAATFNVAPSESSVPRCGIIGGPNFVELVKQVASSVVNISAEIQPTQQNARLQGFDDDQFSQLFKYFGMQPPPSPRAAPSLAFGSGFIISTDGYILTNAHLVAEATKITVKLNNRQQFAAKLIGLDKQTDIALLKIEAKDLSSAKLGDPDKLQIGEWVVAIGAPFGLDNTVTAGIVSAKGRNLPSENYVPFIQTDVAINPGNSGGPLFNTNGEVVGINSQIYSRSGGFMGISFSIPIDVATKIAAQLKEHGKVYHGRLGVQIQEVTPELAKSFALNKPGGALIADVGPNSGAAHAGIHTGDIVLNVDGKEISSAADLPIIIGSKKPGDQVELTILRNGRSLQLMVKLGDQNSGDNGDQRELAQATPSPDKNATANISKFGLQVLSVKDPQVAGQVNAKAGLVVINSSGIAAMAGLSPGDVIVMVNNKIVKSVTELNALLANTNQVALLIERNGQRMYVSLSIN